MIGMMIGTIVAMSLEIKSDSRINEIGINFATVFGFIGMCLVLLLFYLMHRKTLIPLAIQRVKDLKIYSNFNHHYRYHVLIEYVVWYNG